MVSLVDDDGGYIAKGSERLPALAKQSRRGGSGSRSDHDTIAAQSLLPAEFATGGNGGQPPLAKFSGGLLDDGQSVAQEENATALLVCPKRGYAGFAGASTHLRHDRSVTGAEAPGYVG